MEKSKTISRKNLPTKIPTTTFLLWVLALDYWNAPGWLWGVAITIMVIILLSTIYIVFWKSESVDIFEEKGIDAKPVNRHSFQDRLNRMQNKL